MTSRLEGTPPVQAARSGPTGLALYGEATLPMTLRYAFVLTNLHLAAKCHEIERPENAFDWRADREI